MRAIFTSGRLVTAMAAAAWFVVSVAPAAHAQTVQASITLPAVITRTHGLRPFVMKPNWVNRTDCVDDDQLTFVLGITNYAGAGNLEAWVGSSSCQDQDSRTSTAPTCWLVYKQTPNAANNNNTITVNIPARNIVGQHVQPLGLDPPNAVPGTLADCDREDGLTQQLYLDFLFAASTNTNSTIAEWTDIGYDITPPDPPTSLTAGVGDTRLHLGWTLSDSIDLYQYEFFCQPAGAPISSVRYLDATPGLLPLLEAGAHHGGFDSGSIRDAGADAEGGMIVRGTGGASGTGGAAATGGTAGAGGTGGTLTSLLDGSLGSDGGVLGPVCAPTVLVPGSDPVTNDYSAFACGSVTGITATSGTASGLKNNVPYVVTAAGIDSLGNVGVLSNTACATPVQLTDFFELYKDDGGKGGGFCSISPQKKDSSGYVAAALALSALWVSRRKRNIA